MSDENAETAADPGIMLIPRMKGGKWHVIRLWSESVMNDHRLTRASIKVAWGITQFLDDHARYYERRTLLAKRIGMTDRTLDKAIALLTECRHIVAGPEWVQFEDGSKKLLTVTRPRFAAAKGGGHSGHPLDQSGAHSRHPRSAHSRHQGGGHSGHPCNQTLQPDHETAGVEDMAPGSERPEAEDVFDEEIKLPF